MRIITVLISFIILSCNSAFRKYNPIESNVFTGKYFGKTTLLTDIPHKVYAVGYKDSAIITVRTCGLKSKYFVFVFYQDTLYKHNYKNMDIKFKKWENGPDSIISYSDYLEKYRSKEKKVEEYFLLKGKNSEIYKLKNKWYVEFLSTFNAENKQRIELKKIE